MPKDGWLFALDREEARQLFAAARQQNLKEFLKGLQQRSDPDAIARKQACGADWDPIHRCLSDGTLNPGGGEPPLNQCLLGGRQLGQDDGLLAVLVRPDVVPLVAEALEPLTREWLERRLGANESAGNESMQDRESTGSVWARFEQIRDFYRRAAADGLAVVFAAAD